MTKCVHKTCSFEGTDKELQAHEDYVERNGGHARFDEDTFGDRMVDPDGGKSL